MVHLDFIHTMLGVWTGGEVDVVGFLDSPLWLDMPPLQSSGFPGFNETCMGVYSYANVTSVPAECLLAYKGEEWKCIMGQYRMALVKTPYMLVAAQFDRYQLDLNVGHKPSSAIELEYADEAADRTSRLVEWLRAKRLFEKRWHTSFYSPACYSHATSLSAQGFAQNTCGEGAKTMKEAFEEFLDNYLANTSATIPEYLDTCQGLDCGAGCHVVWDEPVDGLSRVKCSLESAPCPTEDATVDREEILS
eukprot:1959720-Amphidinium_carterae.1